MRGLRVGIVGPATPFGARVRELLEEGRLTVTELKLFDSHAEGESTLTRFQDDVVVTQALDEDFFPQLDLCFFSARDTDLLNRVAAEAAEHDVVAVVYGSLGLEAPVAAPGISQDTASERLVAVPRTASFVLGSIAKRVIDRFGDARLAATLLLPAGERGDAGADELHQQVVNLLNFKAPPEEVFQEQLAFNATIAGRGAWSPALAETVAREAALLAGLSDAVTVNLVHVPVFHATSASIWVELSEPAERRALIAAFKEPPFTIDTGRGAKDPTPVSVAESPLIHVGAIRRPVELSHPGFWLWAVADTTVYDPALAAVELARAALD